MKRARPEGRQMPPWAGGGAMRGPPASPLRPIFKCDRSFVVCASVCVCRGVIIIIRARPDAPPSGLSPACPMRGPPEKRLSHPCPPPHPP